MFQEKRPTCVTVIGWGWIIIGGLMCLSAIMIILGSFIIGEMAQNVPGTPFLFKVFPWLAIIQFCLGMLGIVSGINFLKLKVWARNILEGLTWFLLIFILGFMCFWIFNWVSLASEQPPRGFWFMGIVMALMITGVYGVPLAIMLKYLRGPKVRNALNKIDEHPLETSS